MDGFHSHLDGQRAQGETSGCREDGSEAQGQGDRELNA
jgi:hypothetical protein